MANNKINSALLWTRLEILHLIVCHLNTYIEWEKYGKADHRGKATHPPFCSYEWRCLIFEIAIRSALHRHASGRNGSLIELSLSAPDPKTLLFQILLYFQHYLNINIRYYVSKLI